MSESPGPISMRRNSNSWEAIDSSRRNNISCVARLVTALSEHPSVRIETIRRLRQRERFTLSGISAPHFHVSLVPAGEGIKSSPSWYPNNIVVAWFAKPGIPRRYRVAWYPRASPSRTDGKLGSIRVKSSMNLRLYLSTGPDRFKVPRKDSHLSGTCKYSRDIVNRSSSRGLKSKEEGENRGDCSASALRH